MKLILLSIFLFSTLASAFPEFIRKGYPACQSCHLSPSGGGVLTEYGATISRETLSTWNYAPEKKVPKWALLGGDVRYIYLKNENDEVTFPMQADVELAVRPFGNLYLVGSGGIYSREKIPEIHRAYAMYNYTWRKNVFSLRYGKFYPNYGIMTPDHTRKIRAYHLIGRGQETLNVEGSVVGKYGEIFFTSILSDFNLKENYGLFLNQDKSGYAAKWALYAGEWAKFGYSYMVIETIRTKRISQGPFIEAGYAGWYLLAQQDYHENLDVYLYELGYEVFKGFQVYQAYEGDDKRIYGVKWYPIPHVELLAEKRDKTILGMFHYYF